MKPCRTCGVEKPLAEFHKRPDTRDGRFSQCKACHLAKVQEQRARNPELARDYDRKRRAADPAKARALSRKQYRANREERNARSREWRANNATRVAEYNRAWAKEHPEFYVAQAHRRRQVLPQLASEDLTYIALLRRDPCSYCGESAGTIDHIQPLSGEGSGGWGNLTASCRSCNASKGTAALLGFLARAK